MPADARPIEGEFLQQPTASRGVADAALAVVELAGFAIEFMETEGVIAGGGAGAGGGQDAQGSYDAFGAEALGRGGGRGEDQIAAVGVADTEGADEAPQIRRLLIGEIERALVLGAGGKNQGRRVPVGEAKRLRAGEEGVVGVEQLRAGRKG
jgi:hypothetical protein